MFSRVQTPIAPTTFPSSFKSSYTKTRLYILTPLFSISFVRIGFISRPSKLKLVGTEWNCGITLYPPGTLLSSNRNLSPYFSNPIILSYEFSTKKSFKLRNPSPNPARSNCACSSFISSILYPTFSCNSGI